MQLYQSSDKAFKNFSGSWIFNKIKISFQVFRHKIILEISVLSKAAKTSHITHTAEETISTKPQVSFFNLLNIFLSKTLQYNEFFSWCFPPFMALNCQEFPVQYIWNILNQIVVRKTNKNVNPKESFLSTFYNYSQARVVYVAIIMSEIGFVFH